MTYGQESTPSSQPARQRRPQDDEVARLFAENHRRLRRFLIINGCVDSEADDIVQDTILVLRERWDRVRRYEKPVGYWYKVAIRRMWKTQKDRSRWFIVKDPIDHLTNLPEPVDATTKVDQHETLLFFIKQLPSRQLQVLWLRKVADFSEADTAEILSITRGTVKSQLHDAMSHLRQMVTHHDALGKEVGSDGS